MDLFIIFIFGFFLGMGIGIVCGMYQKKENELEDFKKELENK